MTKADRLLEAIDDCVKCSDQPEVTTAVANTLGAEIASIRGRGGEIGYVIEALNASHQEVNSAYERMAGLYKHLSSISGDASELRDMIEGLMYQLNGIKGSLESSHKHIQQATEERNEK